MKVTKSCRSSADTKPWMLLVPSQHHQHSTAPAAGTDWGSPTPFVSPGCSTRGMQGLSDSTEPREPGGSAQHPQQKQPEGADTKSERTALQQSTQLFFKMPFKEINPSSDWEIYVQRNSSSWTDHNSSLLQAPLVPGFSCLLGLTAC